MQFLQLLEYFNNKNVYLTAPNSQDAVSLRKASSQIVDLKRLTNIDDIKFTGI